jgi:hypothetical protein
MQCESYVCLFSSRYDGFEVVGYVLPHLIQRVDCLARKRRQVFDAVVVEIVQPRPTTTGNNFVSLDVTVGVEVVLHNGKTLTAGNLNRLDDGLDIFVAAQK